MSIQIHTITLREAITFMDAGHTFSFLAYSYDKKLKKAGKRIGFQEAKLLRRDVSDTEGVELNEDSNTENTEKIRNANHGQNMTRNIRACVSGVETQKIVKIHLDLLTKFNGRKVVLP